MCVRHIAVDETLDVKSASGVELWAYTMSRERQPHNPAQAVWDAAMRKMEDEYVKDDFRFGMVGLSVSIKNCHGFNRCLVHCRLPLPQEMPALIIHLSPSHQRARYLMR